MTRILWFSSAALAVLLTLAPASMALARNDASARVEGVATDDSGGRLPGVLVEVSSAARPARILATATTDAQGAFTLKALPEGDYIVRFLLAGFARVEQRIHIAPSQTASVTAMLQVDRLSETVNVQAQEVRLETDTSTQSATVSAETLTALPTASRNYTHVIVAEAGVSAPLPDRTGRGMNLATEPGAQAEDAGQSLNPSVNGARPSNNSLKVNGIDTTNMLAASGGLGNNIGIPLDAVQEVEVQTALPSASTGRNGGGNLAMVTRSGTDRFAGSAAYFFQHEDMNANEFFLNRAGTAKPKFRRNDATGTLGGPVLKGRTYFFGAAQSQRFLSGYASNANAATGLPAGLTDVRTPETIAAVANEWLRSGAADNPAFAANFLRGLQAFPAEQQAGLIAKYFANPATLTFRTLQPSDIHPVAINILNTQRNGQFLIPSPSASLPMLPGNGTYGREMLLQQVVPTEFEGASLFGSLQHRFSTDNALRASYVRSNQIIEEAFGWADASPSPTQGDNTSWLAGLTDTHTFGSRLVQEVTAGYFNLQNTRISKNRDILNSTLGIYNPIEEYVGGLAALMPTIDINTQRNSGGIGNAWDFFDYQRVFNASSRWSLLVGAHTLQAGVEYRHINLEGEYMSRTNGDLDYGNWALFFTGNGAAGGGSDLDQGDTRRDFLASDYGVFLQDDWRLGGGLTLNVGLRYDVFGNLTERNGRIGNYYLPEVAAQLGAQPGFNVPGNAPFFQPGFTPLDIGLYIEPGTPVDLSQINVSPNDSTLQTDWNNVAPRVGLAWQPSFAPKVVVRGGWGMYYERPAASHKVDLQRAAPFFIYQNVPAPVDMADPYPRLNVNPFQIPLNVSIVRDANGAAAWRRADGTVFPAQSPFSAKNNTFIDPLIRTPYTHQWSASLQYEPVKRLLVDLRYVGSRGVGLLGKVNLAMPVDPRVTPVNGFTDIRDNLGRLINPDFFVPAEFLGLNRNGGFQQLTNIGYSNYHALQANVRGRIGRGSAFNVAYTYSKSMDVMSSDRSLLEHDPTRPDNNYGLADFDRPHRLTTTWTAAIPGAGQEGSLWHGLTGNWQVSGMFTYQAGTPFTVIGAATTNAVFAQVARTRVSFVPGGSADAATLSGPVQDRLERYFDVTQFRDSGDAWGDTGRNILRGPSQAQLDLTLSRIFPLFQRQRLELRWEVFNALNSPVFANPNSTFAANGFGNAGRITSTIGGPRTMQLAARFTF